MKKYDIGEIEKLVNLMADSYDYPSKKLVLKMNKLICQNWDAETYWEYTCEYWSHHSLQETVYALINDGEYPPDEERNYFIWNTKYPLKKIMLGTKDAQTNVLEETHLFFRLGRYKNDQQRANKFNILPINNIYQWFKDTFSAWELNNDDDDDENVGSISLTFEVEYGISREISLFPYEEKCLQISFKNVEDIDIKRALEYLEQFSTDIYLVD